jgi:hypothetical protein
MQKGAGMVVHAISCREDPVRPARLTQFGITSASTKAGARSRLGPAIHAWNAMSNLCAPKRQRTQMLSTPSKRSHTFATY